MKYNLIRPCAKCPFRTDVPPYLNGARAREIVRGLERGEFACHLTLDYDDADDDGEACETEKTAHCAGALIMLEKVNRPSQMMRICERFGDYDRMKLDMMAPVFATPDAFIRAQSAPVKRARKAR